jgi:hypothetical protein
VADGRAIQHEAKELKLYDQSGRVFIHPSSVLFSEAGFKSGFVAYFAKAETSKVFLRDATEVSHAILLLTVPRKSPGAL